MVSYVPQATNFNDQPEHGWLCSRPNSRVHSVLLASLHDASYYSIATSSSGQLKLITSVRAMVFSNSKAGPRVLISMLMTMNLAAVIAFTIATFAAGEVSATPISKRAVQAALQVFGEAIRVPIGP